MGASPVTVTSQGLVAGYDGYVVPRDADLSGIYDFQEVGSAALLLTSLHTQMCKVFVWGSANFEVQTDLSQPVLQWQIFDGTDWIDLSDDGTYSNTSSSVMTVTPADNSLDNTSYRVTVAKRNYLCNPVISDIALLNMELQKFLL